VIKRLLLVLAACGGSAPPPVVATIPQAGSAAAPIDVAWDQLTGKIVDVSVKASDATLVPKIKDLVAGELGKDLDRTRLREEINQAYALPGVADVLVRGTQRADGIAVELEVTAQPTVHAITAEPKDVALPGQIAAANGLPLDPALLDSVTRALRDQYLANGYTSATARWTTRPAGNQVDVTIAVTPGTATVIQKVEFTGNAHAKTAELEKTIALDVAPGMPWNDQRVARASLLISGYYFDRGYVNVQVTTPQPAATAAFAITEGDQFRVGKLSIKDAKPADEAKLLKLLGVKKGDIFSRSAMTLGMQKLQDATKSTNITPITNIDAAKKTIDVVFDIPKSP
jgi:outer membrane protein assembly factor BamA